MSFSFSEWKAQLKARWQTWRENPKVELNALGTKSLYFGLAGTALYPIAAAVAQGDLSAVGQLYSLGSGVGINLIANSVQKWSDESTAAKDLAKTAEQHPEMVEALDTILQKLDVLSQVQSGLSADDRKWFARTLKANLERIGGTLTIEIASVSNPGSGGIAIGPGAAAAGAGGTAVSGNVYDSIRIYQVYLSPPGRRALTQEEFERILRDYLQWVQNAHSKVRLYGIESLPTAQGRPGRELSKVFVPLTLRRVQPPRREEVEQLAEQMQTDSPRAYLRLAEARQKKGEIVPLQKLLTLKDRVAIVGGAGSGKSTILAYLAASLSTAALTGEDLPVDLPRGTPPSCQL